MGWDGIYWVRASCLWKWWDPGSPAPWHLFPVFDIKKCHRNSIYHLNLFCCILSGPITRFHPVSVFSSLEGSIAESLYQKTFFDKISWCQFCAFLKQNNQFARFARHFCRLPGTFTISTGLTCVQCKNFLVILAVLHIQRVSQKSC